MAFRKGTQRPVQAPDTSGVQRAHEGNMQAARDNVNMAMGLGNSVTQAVGMVQQQSQFDQEMEQRKQRLDVEMAKGGLQFEGEGPDRKIVPTEGAEAEADLAERKVDIAEKRAATEAQRAAAYEMSQQLALIKAGYTDNGELTEDGRTAIQNLSKDYKKAQKTFEAIMRGDENAVKKAQAELPDISDQEFGQAQGAVPEMQEQSGGGPLGAMDRLVKGVRARIDFAQMKFMVNSQGEMPDDVVTSSPAWKSFHAHKETLESLAMSGMIPAGPFNSIKERNRYFNEAAARLVLKGLPAPGSLAEPSVTQGTVPAQAPAGNPDDGSQPAAPQPVPQAGPQGRFNQQSAHLPGPYEGQF